jgi:hypothetical protein
VDVDGWRSVALLQPNAVNDMQLAEFLAGKQILFRVPSTVFPAESGAAVGSWDLRVLRPSVSKGKGRPAVVSVEMHFENFSGNHALLPARMRAFRSSVSVHSTSLVPISLPGSPRGYGCVRSMLEMCYSSDTLLADVSQSSARTSGALPLPPAVSDATVAAARTALPTWHDPHAVALLVVAALSALTPCAPALKASTGKIGFSPRSRKHALAHSSRDLWLSAEQKELGGLSHRRVYDRVTRSSVPPDVRVLGTKYDYTDKSSGPKARCCVRGDQQFPYPASADVFVPTSLAPPSMFIRLLGRRIIPPSFGGCANLFMDWRLRHARGLTR